DSPITGCHDGPYRRRAYGNHGAGHTGCGDGAHRYRRTADGAYLNETPKPDCQHRPRRMSLPENPPQNEATDSPHASHAATVRALLAPAQMRQSLLLASIPSPRNATIAGLQAALAVLLA